MSKFKNMQGFLYNEKTEHSPFHVWTGSDTACRMWSTGGISGKSKAGWVVVTYTPSPYDRAPCAMCKRAKTVIGEGA